MATTQKAIAFQRALQQNLEKRFAGTAVTSSFGSAGDPLVTVAGIAIIRIKPEASINKDVLGLAQTVYTPHIAQVLIDSDVSPVADYGADALKVFGETVLLGVKVEFYSNATLAEGSITGTPVATFDNLQYPLMATV